MSDQAQGLRELVKGGVFEQMGLPAVFDRKPEVDYRKLWTDFKTELSAESEHCWSATRLGGHVYTVGDEEASNHARSFLNRMEQAETLAITKTIP